MQEGHGEENGTWKPETQRWGGEVCLTAAVTWLRGQSVCGINTMTSLSFFLLISCHCSSLTTPIRKPVGKGAIIMHKCSSRAESGVKSGEGIYRDKWKISCEKKGEKISSVHRKKIFTFRVWIVYKYFHTWENFQWYKTNSRESILRIYAEM